MWTPKYSGSTLGTIFILSWRPLKAFKGGTNTLTAGQLTNMYRRKLSQYVGSRQSGQKKYCYLDDNKRIWHGLVLHRACRNSHPTIVALLSYFLEYNIFSHLYRTHVLSPSFQYFSILHIKKFNFIRRYKGYYY